jgi:hypothetical protein
MDSTGRSDPRSFPAFTPVGIRIGLDAKEKLHADPRGLTMTYYNGTKPPRPCVADGVTIATRQGTYQISPMMAVIVIKNRKRRRAALHHL